MSLRLNRHVLEQTRYDSGLLGQLGFVVHPYPDAGHYKVEIYRHDKLQQALLIDVNASSGDSQLSIDLAATEHKRPPQDPCCCDDDSGSNYKSRQLAKGGYALFYVGSGSGGYHVKSYALDPDSKQDSFDSTRLNRGDLFGITLIRPGHYHVTNTPKKRHGKISVEAVSASKTPYQPPEALQIEVDTLTDNNKAVTLTQAQGMVFHASQDDRILIELDADTIKKQQPEENRKTARWSKHRRK
ncbi:hypothetical protein [Ketobacter sp.]|nr:MAG: hypothetical protein D6160_09860 [Ketobacter sp.]